jgi:hypothetical protein
MSEAKAERIYNRANYKVITVIVRKKKRQTLKPATRFDTVTKPTNAPKRI